MLGLGHSHHLYFVNSISPCIFRSPSSYIVFLRWKFAMKSFAKIFCALLLVACISEPVWGGPAAYGICQTGCNAVCVACYFAAGSVMGVGSVPACNVALGVCMTACIAAGAAPTL